MDFAGKRTDLASESAQSVSSEGGLPEGISVNVRKTSAFEITEISVDSEEAAQRIGKPRGRYVTLETEARIERRPENFEQCVYDLADEISAMIDSPESVLVVGLGNEDITPDSLGPRTAAHIFATRHIKSNAPQLMSADLGEVCAITPGVMGQTGIEASEIVKTVCDAIKPSAVIAVDALACSELSHLGKTVQLSNSGISPGSGVMNSRKELSSELLGVPCIAVGVPTIADLSQNGETLMVTPRSVDKMVGSSAQIISAAINLALHRGMTLEEIISLTS